MDIVNLDDESVIEDLDQMVTTLDNNLSNLLKKHVPEITKNSHYQTKQTLVF